MGHGGPKPYAPPRHTQGVNNWNPVAYTEPVYTKPVYTEPVYTEPVYTRPVYTRPVYTEEDNAARTRMWRSVLTKPDAEPIYTDSPSAARGGPSALVKADRVLPRVEIDTAEWEEALRPRRGQSVRDFHARSAQVHEGATRRARPAPDTQLQSLMGRLKRLETLVNKN
jgi:hypothetical protein